MSIPCWIITLHPSSERTILLRQALTDVGVAHEIFPAIDGRKDYPPLQDDEHIDYRKTLLRHRRQLTSSEIGCYLSHYRAIKSAYSRGIQRLCLLEDDVVLEPGFADVLQVLENRPEQEEMIRLMGLRIRRRKAISLMGATGYQLVRPDRGWCGAQGYVINRIGMEKIIAWAKNIFEPIDKVYDHFWEYDLQVYGIEPHVLYELDHPTSVAKSSNSPVSIPLILRILHPIHKLFFSRSRHAYLARHHDAFEPADYPPTTTGKTNRLR